ncbi:TadE-like protein [Methylovirgula ligni]|uniref:TadE-like protein n=2 Tax=Methylovirgula ligni TaxID=569860 RepID=A0A3D9YZ52_9HYPH|nr:TadE-like protein [Methylovirgula ligni]
MNKIASFLRPLSAVIFAWARRPMADRAGVSAVEFALLAPIFCLLLAAAADFGGVLYVKFGLESAVSAAANYALLNASNVNSTNGGALATNLATIVESERAANWANGSIIVNNGPSATINSGAISSGGTAANANVCYCPTGSGASVTWGGAVTCGSTCASGGLAGKFISIVATRVYSPMFSSYGIVKNGAISSTAVAETQ